MYAVPWINDILNSVDVDETSSICDDNFQIDLESLLASEDSHEAIINDGSLSEPILLPIIVSSPTLSFEEIVPLGKEQVRHDNGICSPERVGLDTILGRRVSSEAYSSSKITSIEDSLSGLGNDLIADAEVGPLYALHDAERREARHLKAGILNAPNVLASRQANRVGSSHSNAMAPRVCDLNVISSQLTRNANCKTYGPGMASTICVHAKFIALGTSRGMILLFDHSQEMRQVLGVSATNVSANPSSVTSIAIHESGSVLCCGCDNGEISLWDILKSTCLKRIKELHQNSIHMVRFVCNVFSSSLEDFNNGVLDVFSLDSKGIAQKIRFSKMLWTSFTSTAECLLDGNGGPVHDMAVLPPLNVAASIISRASIFQMIAISSSARTYIIQVQPEVKICFRWALPQHNTSSPTSTKHLHAQSNFSGIRTEDDITASRDVVKLLDWTWIWVEVVKNGISLMHWQPLLARFSDGDLQVLAVSDVLSVHSLTAETTKTKNRHQQAMKFSVLNERRIDHNYDILCLRWLSSSSDGEVLSPMLAVISFSLVWIFRQNLELFQVIPISEQIPRHVGIGRHRSEAACVHNKSMYMLSGESLYEIFVPHWSEEVNRLIRDGRWLDGLALGLENFSTEAGSGDFLESCIKQYVAISMDIIASDLNYHVHYKNHFHLVASVCVEYCSRSNRLALLFGFIYDRFSDCGYSSTFLDALQPYILARSITVVPEKIVLAYFDVTVESQGMKNVSFERLVMFLDFPDGISSTCVEAIIQYLLKNSLFSGLLYVSAYRSPVNFVHGFESLGNILVSRCESEEYLSSLCYKMLLFLRCVSDGLVFPRSFVIDEDPVLNQRSLLPLVTKVICDSRASLDFLYSTDSHALIFCVTKVLGSILRRNGQSDHNIAELYNTFYVYLSSYPVSFEQSTAIFTFFELCFNDLKLLCEPLSEPLIESCIEYFSSSLSNRTDSENSLIELLSAQLRSGNEFCMSLRLRQYLEKLHFWKVLLVLQNDTDFSSALRSYVQLYNQLHESSAKADLCRFIFDFISYQCTIAGTSEYTLSSLCTHIVELARISLPLTENLVLEKLLNHSSEVILNTSTDPGIQFPLLHALIVSVSKDNLGEVFSEADIMLYVRLLVDRKPFDVLPFISSHEHYPLQQCLQLCLEKELYDATAYLMERSGDIKAALAMLHAEISRGLHYVRREAENMLRMDNARPHTIAKICHSTALSDIENIALLAHESLAAQVLRKKPGGKIKLEAALRFPGFKELQKAVKCAADLCTRHGKSDMSIWFPTFDHLLKERQNIRLTMTSSSTEVVLVILSLLLHLFTTQMKTVVPPQDIVRRVAALPGGKGVARNNIFSEFKSVIINMLESYASDVHVRSLLRNCAAFDLASLHHEKYRRLHAGAFSTSLGGLSSIAHADEYSTHKKSYVPRVAINNVSALRNLIRSSSSEGDEALMTQIISLSPPASVHLPSSSKSDSGGDLQLRKPGHLEKSAKFEAVI